MPPKGVTVLGQCVAQAQAEFLARQLDVPQPELELTEWLGEERCVIRVRKVPGWWNVESWSKSAIDAAARDAADVPFDLQGEPDVSFP